ncbi:hypothetical protein KUCAC02_024260 [Chaenocephalus aceratus]|uniref:Uncharacterized protein n=1 Tax=Chaenocephalus aceratus TaxID=36190 RepID=A0ACB9WI50_CHAAC|nr:hypothetical protein KUCAC02_024260 [Chaenocephalus aceratus]
MIMLLFPAVLSDRLILLSFLEQSQVAAVYLNPKNQETPETGRRTDKLSPSEIKMVSVEVSGRGGRRLSRRLALNRLQDVALCWWDSEEPSEELWPWSPTNTHRNNLVLLSCSPAEGLKVLGSLQSEGSPLDCRFSLLQPYQLLTVELPGSREGFWADSCVYECSRGRLHRLSSTRIPLTSRPVSCSRHPSESSLLLGLSDSSLVLCDQRRGVSLLASCPVPPTLLAWHPAGAVVLVGGEQGELMCFDVGLAPVRMALADVLMVAFHGGPLAALRFRLGALTGGLVGLGEMLQQRLRCGQVREALGVLEAMDWSIMGDECHRGLSSITNHLLRLELNAEREALLEAALGVFYAPPAPLPDVVILEFREPISKCARRFFHHLLRHQRFEKAFLLAVDLEDRDLFMIRSHRVHFLSASPSDAGLGGIARLLQ